MYPRLSAFVLYFHPSSDQISENDAASVIYRFTRSNRDLQEIRKTFGLEAAKSVKPYLDEDHYLKE